MSDNFMDDIRASLEEAKSDAGDPAALDLDRLPDGDDTGTGESESGEAGEAGEASPDEEGADGSDKEYTVKVDGKEAKVKLDELIGGYQRQAKFTKDMQALKAERESFETQAAELHQRAMVSDIIENRAKSDIGALVGDLVLAAGDNGTGHIDPQAVKAALSGMVSYLAGHNGALDDSLLGLFGIEKSSLDAYQRETNRRRDAWRREADLEQKTREVQPLAAKQEEDRQVQTLNADIESFAQNNSIPEAEFGQFRKEVLTFMTEEGLGLADTARAAKFVLKERALRTKEKELSAPRRSKSPVTKPSRPGGGGERTDKNVPIKDDIASFLAQARAGNL